jgi:hypothetical protein
MHADRTYFRRLAARWGRFHRLNPRVWECFEEMTLDKIAAGQTKLSAWLVVNEIRWEVALPTVGSEFKISNEMMAYYSRLWRKLHPKHAAVFDIKHIRGEPPGWRPGDWIGGGNADL